MRIISQNGRIDFPYENFSLSITKDNCIVATRDTVASISEISISVIAEYPTEAKARKAMEMLIKACCGSLHIYVDQLVLMAKNYASRPELLKLLNEAVESVKYFRFPADDEIEV